jgi:hypothetical protein
MLDWSQNKTAYSRPGADFSADAAGLIAGTLIATEFGWRSADALSVGDRILTFDHGFRKLVGLRRTVLWNGVGHCPDAILPISIAADVLDNHEGAEVLPDQGIMVESDAAEEYRGDPFAVIRAAAVASFGLAERLRPQGAIEAVILEFEEDEVVHGRSGLLYFVPRAYDFFEETPQGASYKILNAAETSDVLEEIWEESI